MRDRTRTLAAKSWLALAVVMVLVGLALVQAQAAAAQQQPPQRPIRKARAPVRDQGGAPAEGEGQARCGRPAGQGAPPARWCPGTYHFNFRLHSFDGAPLAASYYRSKLGSTAPVVMLIHESGRSRKDFEDPVLELKGQGLAEHLQGLDYAVLSLDLRGQGQNPRRALTRGERTRLVEDLQAAYFFLVDRHNRGELNLSKLGVIALGDGANLAAAWAYPARRGRHHRGTPQRPQRPGPDLAHARGLRLCCSATSLPSLATRIPMLLLAGEHDIASKDAMQAVRPLVERARLNKVELYPSSLHGYKLLRLEPKVTSSVFRFLDTTLKSRAVAWEPAV